MRKKTGLPWDFLEEYRKKMFFGTWPTLPEMFRITQTRFPDRNCFTDFEPSRVTLTYTEALEKIETLASWLVSRGLEKGDHVAVTGKNSPEWAVVYMAALFAGGVIVPIDYALHNDEISNLLNTARPKFLFVDEEKYEFFQNFAVTHDSVGMVLGLHRNQGDEYVYALKTSRDVELPAAGEHDEAAILFTSGTTGIPKGVVLTHQNLVSDCYIAQTQLTIFETDVFYALLPLHHSYTMLAVFIETMSCGAEVVFGKSLAVSRMLRELKEGKITMLLGVPLLFNKLLAGIMRGIKEKGPVVFGIISALMKFSFFIKTTTKWNIGKHIFAGILKKASLENLRIAISGGGPLTESVCTAYNAFGIDFVQGYGLTETSPIIALNPLEHFKVESVGRDFYPHMDTKILSPDSAGVGEICVKGPMVMQGYYKMPEETAKVLDDEGWFRTGDLGYMDSERYLYLCGRAKNMIVTDGGKNVYPEEIENAFQLYYDDIDQITAQGFMSNENLKVEGIEVLVYPTDDLIKRLDVLRGSTEGNVAVYKHIEGIVAVVNKTLQPYQRVARITLLDEPLEMTTTKKVKRNYVQK